MNALDVFADARPDIDVDDGALDAIAAEVFDGVPRRSGGDARWRLLAVAAAVVALVAGLALVVGRPDAPSPADTVPPVIPDDGEPLRMLPSDLGARDLTGFLSGRAPSTWNETVLARPLADGSYVDKVVVRRGPRDQLWFDVGNVAVQGAVETSPLITRGRVWDVVSAGPNTVFAQTDMDDGSAIQVAVDATSDLDRSREAVLTVATSLGGATEQPPQGVAFDPLPAGFHVVADVAPLDPWARFLTVEEAGAPSLQVITYASDDPDLGFRLMAEDLRPVTVRGVTGFASTLLLAQRVIWQEAPGQWVVVQSDADATTADELISFAETLQVVTADEWSAIVALPPGWEPGYPATTAPAPATSVAPHATTAPQTAPPGSLLVANATNVGGVAAQWSTSFEIQGADALDPVNAVWPDGEPAPVTRIYARPGSEALGAWVAEQIGDVTVELFDALDPATIEGDLTGTAVVVVIGLSNVDPALVQPPPTTLQGSVLVASNIAGLGKLVSRPLAERGATVLGAALISTEGEAPIETTRVFARPVAADLGAWVAGQLGVSDVEPMDRAAAVLGNPDLLVGEVLGDVDLDAADVIVVVGRDRASVDGRAAVPWIFGDSVTQGAAAELTARGYVVSAAVSRPLVDAIEQVEALLMTVRPNIVVLQLATNGPIRRNDLDRMLAATADVPNVILVNARADREWVDANNALLAEVDEPGDNLILMDWDALADQCPGECFAEDGIHLTEAGVAYFVERLTDITGI